MRQLYFIFGETVQYHAEMKPLNCHSQFVYDKADQRNFLEKKLTINVIVLLQLLFCTEFQL